MKHIKPILESSNFDGYSLKQIVDGLKNKSIKIDSKFHNNLSFKSKKQSFQSGRNINKYFTDYIINMYKDSSEFMERMKNKTLGETYIEMMNNKFKIGDQITSIMNLHQCFCSDCGDYLYPYLQDQNTIGFIGQSYYKSNKRNNKIDLNKVNNCKISVLGVKDKLVSEINVASGELVFVNTFRNEDMNDNTDNEIDINNLLGRYELMEFLSKKDIACCQMSNMSVDIFVKNDSKEIIVGESFYYDAQLDIEGEREYPGYKHEGNISCGVWRWMCADKKVLEKYGEKITDDSIIVKVKPGTWVIEHYYDVIGERKDGIYSKMYLKS